MEKITLSWMDKIRMRMIEVGQSGWLNETVLHPEVEKFINPILEYGEKEEERITKGFEERRKKLEEKNDKS